MDLYIPQDAHEQYGEIVSTFFATPHAFCYMCPIISINDRVELMNPTAAQQHVAQMAQDNRFIWVNKYRQAFITTLMDVLLLRDCMYGEGLQGALVAQKEDTHREHMRRISFMYSKMQEHPEMKHLIVPLRRGTSATVSGIEFEHGGGIWPITAGSDSPGVGRSFARVVETESCEMPPEDFNRLNLKFYPTITKRPNGRIWRESTPGRADTPQHRAWLKALKGNSLFKAVFLEWWTDKHNTRPIEPNFGPITEEEKEFARKLPGITKGHVYFRRFDINDFCDGDEQVFETKYPSGPLKGWSRQTGNIFNYDKLHAMYDAALSDSAGEGHFAHCLVAYTPLPRHRYIVVVDPADFGAKGDNSAIVVFDRCTWNEVAKFEGRVDPTDCYRTAKAICSYYNDALLIPESNCSAFVALAVNDESEDTPELYWEKKGKPGWNANNKSLQEAEAATNELLKDDILVLNFASTIEQMIHFDGKRRDRRVTNRYGEQSHFDAARCVVIAAHFLHNGGYCPPISDAELRKIQQQKAARQAEKDRENFIKALKRNGRYEAPANNDVWAPGAARRHML